MHTPAALEREVLGEEWCSGTVIAYRAERSDRIRLLVGTMPAEKIVDAESARGFRLKHACGASVRMIARSLGVGHTTVGEYLRRTAVIGITWPVLPGIDDAEMERRLFTPAGFYTTFTRAMPDWNDVHPELRRRGVTLLQLWEEYRAEQPEGYGYSRFCDPYIEWRKGVSATMRQTHVAGERLFVDYAGDTVRASDVATAKERRAHIFVAVLISPRRPTCG